MLTECAKGPGSQDSWKPYHHVLSTCTCNSLYQCSGAVLQCSMSMYFYPYVHSLSMDWSPYSYMCAQSVYCPPPPNSYVWTQSVHWSPYSCIVSTLVPLILCMDIVCVLVLLFICTDMYWSSYCCIVCVLDPLLCVSMPVQDFAEPLQQGVNL